MYVLAHVRTLGKETRVCLLCLRRTACEINKTAGEHQRQREAGIWFFSSLMYHLPKIPQSLKSQKYFPKSYCSASTSNKPSPQGYWHFRWFHSKGFCIFPSVISLFPRDAPQGMNTCSGWALLESRPFTPATSTTPCNLYSHSGSKYVLWK